MTEFIHRFEFSDLASRSAAASLRRRIEEAVAADADARLDFGEVQSISESFADELFGVLVRRKGLAWLLDHVALEDARDEVLASVARAIRARIEEDGASGSLADALAAVAADQSPAEVVSRP